MALFHNQAFLLLIFNYKFSQDHHFFNFKYDFMKEFITVFHFIIILINVSFISKPILIKKIATYDYC